MHQRSGSRRAGAKEGEQCCRAVARDGQAKKRVARGIEQTAQARQVGHICEGGEQILGVAIRRVPAEMLALAKLGEFYRLPGTRHDRTIQQEIVFQKAQKHDRQDPVHRGLVQRRAEEGLERVCGSARVTGLAPLRLGGSSPCGAGVVLAQILLQPPPQPLEVGQQKPRIDHCLAETLLGCAARAGAVRVIQPSVC